MKKQLPLLLSIILFFGFFVTPVSAVSMSLSQLPSNITTDSFTFTASISGAASGTNYLRMDLYKDGTSNYFGETYNNSDWYSGSDYTQYLPITVISGKSWIGQIQGRVGNPTITQYDGNGIYRLRLRRYTGSGSYTSSEADATSTIVTIAFPTITPTPLPTDTPVPTSSPTPIKSGPTPTPKSPTPTPTLKPSSTPKPLTPTSTNEVEPTDEVTQTVLADTTEAPKPSPTTAVLGATARPNILAIVFFSLGGILFLICGILLFRQYRLSKFNESNN